MKKLFLIALTAAWVCISHNGNAQSVVASAGAFTAFSAGSVAWTLGEVITDTYSSANNFFTQGFNQPDTAFVTAVPNSSSTTVSIYPNPVAENLVVDFSTVSGKYLVEVLDMQGQILRKEFTAADKKQLQISFSEYADGIYLLSIINTENNSRNSYKINKIK